MKRYTTPVRRSIPTRLRIAVALTIAVAAGGTLNCQQKMEGTVGIGGETRTYAVYLPSSYDPGTPNTLVLALHPLNAARWNARSWRDLLTPFAEAAGTILVCPDGGPDGHILSEEVDTLLATALLDSVAVWFNVDEARIYAMGFSVGALATYVYGLSNPSRFGGYLTIGAAVNRTTEIGPLLPNADGKPFYIVHGAGDSPNVRFHPVVEALRQNGAVLESLLMSGVGHTIDFPDRDRILTDAFRWIDSTNLARTASGVDDDEPRARRDEPYDTGLLRLYPNPMAPNGEGTFRWNGGSFPKRLRVVDLSGKPCEQVTVTFTDRSTGKIVLRNLPAGVYFLEAVDRSDRPMIRFVVR